MEWDPLQIFIYCLSMCAVVICASILSGVAEGAVACLERCFNLADEHEIICYRSINTLIYGQETENNLKFIIPIIFNIPFRISLCTTSVVLPTLGITARYRASCPFVSMSRCYDLLESN